MDRRNFRHLAEWRLFLSLRSFVWVSLMMIVTEYFRTLKVMRIVHPPPFGE